MGGYTACQRGWCWRVGVGYALFLSASLLWSAGVFANNLDQTQFDPSIPDASAPRLGLAKAAETSEWLGERRFRTLITLRAVNTGTATAKNINIVDNLAASFAGVANFSVVTDSLVSDLFQVNSEFDGINDTSLLAAGNTLISGAGGRVEFLVEFEITDTTTFLTNSAELIASNATTDISTQGDQPDPNKDGLPDEQTPTTIVYQLPQARLGLAKAVSGISSLGNNVFQTEFELTVENFGAGQARDINIKDNLAAAFEGVEQFAVVAGSLTSPVFSVNSDFDGINRQNLLAHGNTLNPGAIGRVNFVVEFQVNQTTPLLANAATVVSADIPSDDSTPGGDPDPNGDDLPDEIGSTPIPAKFVPPETGVVGLAKEIVEQQVSGRSVVTRLQFVLENLSDQDVAGLQLIDDLNQTFPQDVSFSVEPGSLISSSLPVNDDYDGAVQTNLLSSNANLAARDRAELSFVVQFYPDQDSGTFFNSAQVLTSDGVMDISTAGNDPDPDDDGSPEESEPTAISYSLPSPTAALVGIAKTVGEPVLLDSTRFQVTYTLTVENFGDAPARELRVFDSLVETFAAAESFNVVPGSLVSSSLQANPDFDGQSDVELLDAGNELAPGAIAQLQFSVVFSPPQETVVFSNTAQVSATDVAIDDSVGGVDPDPNGNNVPDEAAPTQFTFDPSIFPPSQVGVLGLAKSASVPVLQDGVFVTALSFVLENLGKSELTDIQLMDNLRAVFPAEVEYDVIEGSLRSASLSIDSRFDGDEFDNLLTGGDRLPIGARAVVSFELSFSPNGNLGPYFNSATATAQGDVLDISTDGVDPDPDSNGEPVEQQPTKIEVAIAPAIALRKSILSIEQASQGFVVVFQLTVANTGDVPLADIQLIDDLQASFPDALQLEVQKTPLASGDLTQVAETFSIQQPELLSGAEGLSSGASGEVTFSILLRPGDDFDRLVNLATVQATAPDGQILNAEAAVDLNLPGGLTGVVYLDRNYDDLLDEIEPFQSDYVIELLDSDALIVQTVSVDDSGRFTFTDLPTGEYVLQYRQQDSIVVWGSRPAEVTMGSVTVVNLPVSPQGVVYASSMRSPVSGVQVALVDQLGQPLPEQCLLPGQQNQVTDDTGRYVFSIQYGGGSRCPAGSAVYQLVLVAVPPDFRSGFSQIIEAEQGVFEAEDCTAPCLLQEQSEPPPIGFETDYYTAFRSALGNPVLINNHLPIDRSSDGGPLPSTGLTLEVQANPRTVRAGGVVGYVITVTNTSNLPATAVAVIDQLAPAISRIADTTILVAPGDDAVFGTADDIRQDWVVEGSRQSSFAPFDLLPQAQVQIEFVGMVSAAARPGPQENRSSVTATFLTGPEVASDNAVIKVISDVLMDKATVIGKVFQDTNRDGIQRADPLDEPGLAGVRLLTPEGLIIETDQHGRFHIADIEFSRSMGINYVVKIDTNSLPEDARILSDLRQVVRLMPGSLGKINFAVEIPSAYENCCSTVNSRGSWDPFRPEKKLDVWVTDVGKVPSIAEDVVAVNFRIASNYIQALGSGVIRLYASGQAMEKPALAETCFDFATGAVGKPFNQLLHVPIAPGSYEYVLRVFEENICSGLGEGPSDQGQAAAFDQTTAQLLDLNNISWPLSMGEPMAGRDLIEIGGIKLSSAVRRLIYQNDQLLSEALVTDSESYEEAHGGSWRIDQTSRPQMGADELPRFLSANKMLEVNFDWRGVADAATVPPRIALNQGPLAGRVDKMAVFMAEGTTAKMTCCNVETWAGTFLDDNNSVTTLRLSNRDLTETLSVCVKAYREVDGLFVSDQSSGCMHEQQLLPQATSELFLGTFENGPLSTGYWDQLRVTLQDSAGREFYYTVLRSRSAEDGELRPPRVTATCFDVSATPQVTEDRGVASITLTSDAASAPLPAQNYGVGVLDLTIGHNQRSGDLANGSIDEQWDRGSYSDGRIAGYWRGVQPVGERALDWVLQIDSTKDELQNLTDNLQREDPDRIFRQLDGDLYYPTYGDDSTTLLDTNSQGAFYARVNYGQSHALWGNYNTQLTGTEFSHYNRSLYGLQTHIQSDGQRSSGKPRHALKLFGSQAQSSLAHAEFGATGGSLYYLRHTDIVMGSEKVWVEVRRQNSEQIEEREILVAGRDYEVDPLQGRILLRQPLSQIMQNRWQSVVQSLPLDGDRVFLMVDYEYVPNDFAGEDILYGGRLETTAFDNLVVGLSHITEQQYGDDYQLDGLDAKWDWGDNSYVSAEYGHASNLTQAAGLRSFDGGLTFDSTAFSGPATDIQGEALGFESYVDLADLSEMEGLVRMWWKRRGEGFNSGRYAAGPKFTDVGIDFALAPKIDWLVDTWLEATTWQLTGSAGETERQGVSRDQIGRLQLSGKHCNKDGEGLCRYLDVEGRYERSITTMQEDLFYEPFAGYANLLGVRFGQDLKKDRTIYAALQKVVTSSTDYLDNDRVAIGLNNKLSDGLSVSLEGSTGDRGNALVAGVDFTLDKRASVNMSSGVGSGALTQFSSNYQLSEGHEIYGSYRVNPDRNDSQRNMLTFGQRRDVGSRTRIFTESQFGKQPRQASTGHVLGLEYDADQNWVISSTLQKSLVERSLGDYKRTAVSVGTTFQDDTTRLSARLEVRNDKGGGTDLSQYLTSTALTHAIDENRRLLAKLNVSWLKDRQSSRKLGRFVEFDLGYAIRPAFSDRLNLLSRYAYLFDAGTQGQSDSPGDERSHVFATEGLYELTRRLQVGGKLAYRKGENRVGKGEGDWFDLEAGLAIARLEYQFVIPDEANSQFFFPDELELIAEYRWLKDFAGDGLQQGALLGIYKQLDGRRFNFGPILAPSLRIGVGYNFSGFDDDMRSTTFKSHGWFVDMMALF